MKTLLAIVLLIALPVRVGVALHAAMLSRDGVHYLWYAQHLAADPWTEIQRQDHHPLYPALVLAAHTAMKPLAAVAPGVFADPVTSWTLAGLAVTMLAGLAVVLGVHALTAALFDRRTALIAAFLTALAAEFCQHSADALTDMPHLAVFLFALAAAAKGLEGDAWPRLAAAGALSGIAFLIRPEGAEVALAAAATALFLPRHVPLTKRFRNAACIALAALLIAAPYMFATGRLIKKKPITRFLGITSAADPSPNGPALNRPIANHKPSTADHRPLNARVAHAQISTLKPMIPVFNSEISDFKFEISDFKSEISDFKFEIPGSGFEIPPIRRSISSSAATPPPDSHLPLAAATDAPRALLLVLEQWNKSLRVTLTWPMFAWLVLRRRKPARAVPLQLVLAVTALHALVVFLLILRFNYAGMFTLRHTLVFAALTLPFAAAGIAAGLDLIPPPRRRRAAALNFTILIVPTFPWMLESRYAHLTYIRRTGEWIRAQAPPAPRILTTRTPVVFYAAGQFVWAPLNNDIAATLTEARTHHPHWIVFDEHRVLASDPAFFDALHRALLPGESLTLRHAEHSTRNTHRALVYRYHPPP